MKKLTLILLSGLFTGAGLFSQNVAINTTGTAADNSSMLDVSATNKGILVPRVALTATTDLVTVATPANSLLVYNTATAGVPSATEVTPGYYYFNTASNRWIRLLNNGDAWLTTGNYLGANGIFGTLTNFSVVYGTNGFIRGAMLNTGETFYNNVLTYYAGDILASHATGTSSGINGYLTGTGAGSAAYFQSGSTNVNSGVADFINTGTSGSWGVYSDIQNAANTHPSVAAVTRNLTSTGVAGAVNATSTITILVGGSGGAFISPTTGVYATASTAANGVGGLFSGNGVGSTSPVNGAGSASNGLNMGLFANATSATGTGGVFAGNGSGTITMPNGSGIASTGTGVGVYGIGTTAASGTGGVFSGNNLGTLTLAGGSGIAAVGNSIGVFGYSATNANGSYGGYFERNGGFAVAVCANVAGTNYKIVGGGTNATVVPNLDNKKVIMHSPESPEILFQDFGKGKLVNGYAKIVLDPIFAKNIFVDDSHPLKVFVQLEGDCNGVYVANKTENGFEVKELQNGNSNVEFTWFASGNRVDEKDENGNVISKNQDIRFPLLPDAPQTIQHEKVNVETIVNETIDVKKEEIRKELKKLDQ